MSSISAARAVRRIFCVLHTLRAAANSAGGLIASPSLAGGLLPMPAAFDGRAVLRFTFANALQILQILRSDPRVGCRWCAACGSRG